MFKAGDKVKLKAHHYLFPNNPVGEIIRVDGKMGNDIYFVIFSDGQWGSFPGNELELDKNHVILKRCS